MADNKTHFEIPKSNVRNESFTPTGRSPSYTRENYTEHGKKILDKTNIYKKKLINKKDIECTNEYFLQLESPTDIKIKSAKQFYEHLGFEIVNYSTESNNIATAKIDKKKFSDFEEKANTYTYDDNHPNKTYIKFIEDIADIPIDQKINKEIEIESDTSVDIIVSLYNVISSKERTIIIDKIEEELNELEIESEKHTFINGLTTITCSIPQNLIKSIFQDYTTVKEININHTAILTEQSFPVEDLPNPLTIESPISESVIAIIDNGITDTSNIFNNLIEKRIPYLPRGAVRSPNSHGSFVASRCLFGDNIDSCLLTHKLTPYCKIIDIPIFGIDSTDSDINVNEFHLMHALESIIPELSNEVKVYNLSLGFSTPIDTYKYSNISKLIDYLSKKFKIIFIIAAGNISTQLGDFPKEHFNHEQSRIGSPAESLLALSVGSIAKYENDFSLSRKDYISPFSRIGPGADTGVKPEVVTHGGNLAKGYKPIPRLATYGISNDIEKLSADNGTSFSAPIISQYAQKLFDSFPNIEPNLVKALLCHFSNKKYLHNEIDKCNSLCLGFGEPDIESALYAKVHSAAYIYEGSIKSNEYQYVPFHIPELLAEDDRSSKLRLKITLVYDPITNPDNDLEYSGSRLSLSLLKPTLNGFKQVVIPADDKYLVPWNPIIKYDKAFSKSYLTGKWELRLRLYTRGFDDTNYIQNYALVIEVIDNNNIVNVYNSILKEYGNFYQTIILKNVA